MSRFSMIEDAYLEGRVERLKREELDLRERLAKRVSAVESEDRWLKSDPLYQRLSSVLAGVREALCTAEEELLRGASAPPLSRIVAFADKEERASNARLPGQKRIRLARLLKQRFSDRPAYQS